MIAIEQSLGLWIPQVQGRYINEDWNAENEGFGAQCWDLAANWSKYLGLPVINTGGAGRWPGWAGNMVDAFPQTPAIAAAYELIGPEQTMQAGDIVVWGDSYWYYPKTHVAVGVQEAGNLLLCASQNSTASQVGNPYPQWTTGPTTLQHLPKEGLLGYIRPRVGIALQGTITPEEDFLTTEQYNDLRAIAVESQLRATAARDAAQLAVRIATENQRRISTVWATPVSRAGKRVTALQELADVKTKLLGLEPAIAEIQDNTDPAALASLVPDTLAQQVIDALAARLAGGTK